MSAKQGSETRAVGKAAMTGTHGARLDPVDGVEQGGGGAVAGGLGVDALNVGVAVLGKEIHEMGLDRL